MIPRYVLFYETNFQDEYPALSREAADGDWCRFEDVLALAAKVAGLEAQLTALREAVEPYLVGQPWLDYRRNLEDYVCSEGEGHTMGEHRALARAMEVKNANQT